jgi:prepilin-type N-terminal cleavage/methylation domain-containing protein
MKKFKENNKGFSLVELIVVIAIMVVLIAVLGSTILGYVDKSKYSKDISALDSVNTAVKTFVAEPDSVYTDGTTYKLSTLMTDAHDPNGVLESILKEVFAADGDFNNASKSFAQTTTSNVFVKISGGAVSIHVDSVDSYADYGVGEKESITNGVTPQ